MNYKTSVPKVFSAGGHAAAASRWSSGANREGRQRRVRWTKYLMGESTLPR